MRLLRSLTSTLGRGALGVLAEILALTALLFVAVVIALVLFEGSW